jgi:hypothetical protein
MLFVYWNSLGRKCGECLSLSVIKSGRLGDAWDLLREHVADLRRAGCENIRYGVRSRG